KTFPGVKALDDVRFELKRGGIHGLMGENGAGKSTFIKIITGVYQPDDGEIFLEGEPVHFHTPKDAQRNGVAAIYQHVTCYPDLSVTENIFMGHEKTKGFPPRIDWTAMNSAAQDLLDQLDANFRSQIRMGDLSVARQQIVEIAKALSTEAKIIIMDEPTAALTQHESEELYRITESLRDRGVSIIFISHRMEDIKRLADHVTVFRDSRYIGSWPVEETTQDKLIVAMVGREITQMYPQRNNVKGKELLRVENLTRIGYFRDISFSLQRGEILALTGLVGAGRTEVCEAIYGITPLDSGSIYLEGKPVTWKNPVEAQADGLAFLPEDRQKQGLILNWEIGKNITLPALDEFSVHSWMNQSKERKEAGRLATKLNVKANSIDALASTLSGGNQQKVVFAKLLTNELKLLVLDEPTKGVDIGAKAAIYEIIKSLAEEGFGIILISSEMPEVLGMSDRIVVMKEGHLTAELRTQDTNQEEILNAAMVVETPRQQSAEGAHG
ncbi:MAG: sugar ABC transporter ATP-binding protein, partial [Spirochaetaceae bacterium]|nr:sugar ABC transporter ATP-binding protein [Spirochaetaceae bacterium]